MNFRQKINAQGEYILWEYDNYYGNTSTDTSYMYNNMIQMSGSYYAFVADYLYNNKWYNNSFNFKGSDYGGYVYQPFGSELVNNNWHSEGGYYGFYLYDLPDVMDYNNLDWNGGQYWGVIGTYAFSSLTQQQQQYSGLNKNSVDIDPEFDSPSSGDLRSYSSALNNIGTKTWLTTDIDGNSRPASVPGAPSGSRPQRSRNRATATPCSAPSCRLPHGASAAPARDE